MKLTDTYNGKPIELELTEEQVEVLKQREKKKTGWERAERWEKYFYCNLPESSKITELGDSLDVTRYECANYCTDETLAKNIARAQALQRKLWRRSAELCEKMNLRDSEIQKYCITYDVDNNVLYVSSAWNLNDFRQVYFDTKEHAEQVIEEFRDGLIWYFTKFKSRMD